MNKNHPVLPESDRFEPRLKRAIKRAALKIRAGIDHRALARAIGDKDVRAALAALPDVADAFEPMRGIIRDAVLRGGRVSEQVIRGRR
jgi:hypothetical protein